uniref:Zinc metalloproteinase n=1 Tax=Steinernema glaseri TaxID=37863 RepID=A0A1I8AAD5_9BILA
MRFIALLFLFALGHCLESHDKVELDKIALNFPDQDPEEVLEVKEGLKLLQAESQAEFWSARPAGFSAADLQPVPEPHYDVNAPNVDIFKANKDLVEYLYQGDIILSPEEVKRLTHHRGKRNALNGEMDPKVRWETDRPIPYTISSTISAKNANLIRQALNIWSNNTCLTFKEDGDAAGTTLIQFISGGGCSSFVGKQYKRSTQTVSIGGACGFIATILHEIGHALGMHHTQSRFDRDEFVYIDRANVYPNLWFNYKQETEETNYNYGVRYDYGSIMHYAPTSFAINTNKPTLIAKMNPNYHKTMGQRVSLAFSDIWLINAHHKCLDRCSRYRTPCQNGGYPNPRECSTCICPDGFSGRFCADRDVGDAPQSCGQTVQATATWTNLKGSIGKDVWDEIPEMKCFFHINAPANRRIEIRLNSIPSSVCTVNCQWGHTEFKVTDPRYFGYRFCCDEDARGKTFTSEKNQLVIVLRSAFHFQKFDIDYRLVQW